jgi:predicted tellurium resistance membrane protein TerC
MFEWFSDPNAWISLLTLTILEIVLGVDNIIFISILAGKLPPEQQGKARNLGLIFALVTRVLLLGCIFLLTKLTKPLFVAVGYSISGKDLVMLFGGLFLIWKSVKEIHHAVEGEDHEKTTKVAPTMASVIGTIIFVDVLFSLDSVITAVGLVGGDSTPKADTIQAAIASLGAAIQSAPGIPTSVTEAFAAVQGFAGGHASKGHGNGSMTIMILAIVISMAVMLLAAKAISDFVNNHPTVKMLALSFLILVGFVLVADGLGHHVPKGYVYFAMAFSFIVEALNIRMRSKSAKPVELRKEY